MLSNTAMMPELGIWGGEDLGSIGKIGEHWVALGRILGGLGEQLESKSTVF